MNAATATGVEIAMPRLSDSMEEGTILSWLAEPGQTVSVGDDLVEIETDKATMTVASEAAGMLEILASEGETLPVGAPIARLGDGAAQGSVEPVERDASAVEQRDERAAPAAATPLARRAARLHGLDLGAISGSGPRGRVVKADVLEAAGVEEPERPPSAEESEAQPPTTAPATVEGARGASSFREPSRLQAVVARRMSEAKATVPHFQVETEVRMDAASSLRAQLKAIAGDAPAPSLNDLIVKATASALRDHPKANGSFREGGFELHERVNVGIAVAAYDALVVPTIFDADRKSLGAIGRESRFLAERVRSGEITPPELAGATFTVSNLGMFGMTAIYPVVNPPQAAILGVGATRQQLVRGEGGGIEDVGLMTLTLSCDHRILYGVEAAAFLSDIGMLLEEPLLLAL